MKKTTAILIILYLIFVSELFSCDKKGGASSSCAAKCCIHVPLKIYPEVNCDYINFDIISGTVREIYNEEAFFFITGKYNRLIDIKITPDDSKPVKMTIECYGSQSLFWGYSLIDLFSRQRLNCFGKYFIILKYTEVDATNAPPGIYKLCHKIEVNYSEI